MLVPNLRTTFTYYQPISSVETERGLVTKVPPDSLIYHYKTTIFIKKKPALSFYYMEYSLIIRYLII